MSGTQDCQAIEKGLKDIIFGMSSGQSLPKLIPNTFPAEECRLLSSVDNAVFVQNSPKISFTKLSTTELLHNQTNSSELIDLNALTEFTAKHFDDSSFKSRGKERKLPHPELEDDCQATPTNPGVSVLFEKIQNSPNFINLPENPLTNHHLNAKKKNMEKEIKTSPSHYLQNSPKKKRRKKKSTKKETTYPSFLENNNKTDVKTFSKENKEDMSFFKLKKNAFSAIGKEYSIVLDRESYKFQCHICNYSTESIGKHISSMAHQKQKELSDKDMMLPFLPEPMPAQVEAITELLITQISKKGLIKEDLEARNALSSTLTKFVEDTISICSLALIGSSAYGIGLRNSEVDFVIKVSSEEIIPDALEALYNAINKASSYEKVVADFKLKRPQVRFIDRATKLSCNILIDNSTSWKLANILSLYCKLDDRVQILGSVVRFWAKLCDIDKQDRGTLPSFSYALLVVHFLQQVQPPVLPVLHEENDYSSTQEYYEKYLKECRWKSQNIDSVGLLWLKFLRYYNFEYKIGESVVSIRTLKRSNCSERNWTTKFYAIEEPFSKRNIAYVIPTFQVCQFIQNCFCKAYRYFAYPQMQKGCQPIPLLKTEEFDPLKLFEAVEDTTFKDDESEISENEDAITLDLEDHDPDIPFENLVSTVTNLSLDEEVVEDENLEDEIGLESSIANCSEQDEVLKNSQLDKSSKETHNKTSRTKPAPVCYWNTEGSKLSKEIFFYVFDKVTLRGEKTVPLICGMCKKSGHSKKGCPIEDLPTPQPLPPMTQEYLDAMECALTIIYRDNLVDEIYLKEIKSHMLEIESSIKEVFSGAKLSLFGSFCNGFGFQDNSDMDYCLTFTEDADGKNLDSTDVIHKVAAQLRNHPRLQNIVSITSAKVPIVKFSWKDSNLEGDISLYNTLALNNTEMLEAYSKIDQRVQKLGYALKYFAKILNICDASRGSLSSYAYILMVLYFLQQRNPPVIPVLQELYEGDKPVKLIDDWNVWYFKDIHKLKDVWPDYGKNDESVAQLWLGLLCFYASDFDWKEYVISIRQKKPLRRFSKLWVSDELAIEDPFDLKHNLGSGLSKKMNMYILKAFIKGRERFGSPLAPEKMFSIHNKELSYFFDRNFLNAGCEPPHDRGCGNCGKIGHIRKDCPQEKTCSYCRKPGHLIRNCPRKKNWPKKQGNKKEIHQNSDIQFQERREMKHIVASHPLMTYPGMNSVNQSLESQKMLQMGVPAHRMPPPGFAGRMNPPPGFKASTPASYPPAFNSSLVHVPPFPPQAKKNELHSQSPPKQYAMSPPKNFQSNKVFRQGSEQPRWPVNSRHLGLQLERHPNPLQMHWQNRPRDAAQHKSNKRQQTDHRQTRTNATHRPYNSNSSDRWFSP